MANPVHQTKQSPAPLVQRKLQVNEPGDTYEQEADAMADTVMRMIDDNRQQSTPKPVTGLIGRSVQRKCATCEEEEKKNKLMRKEQNGVSGAPVSSSFSASLINAGKGMPLQPGIKQKMEQAFNTDLSPVRIHTGHQAAALNNAIHAKAFTYGNDIYFNEGEYKSDTQEGKKLLAHELTHVLQQQSMNGSIPDIQRKDDVTAVTSAPAQTPAPATSYTAKDGSMIDMTAKKLLLSKLMVADELNKFVELGGFHTFNKRQRPDDQRSIWEKETMGTTIDDMIKAKAAGNFVLDDETKTEYYYFKIQGVGAQAGNAKTKGRKGGNQNFGLVFGTMDDIKDRLKLPFWNKAGKATDFDVDHMVEWQIGGKHDMTNFWLWESAANRSAGSTLNNHINTTITNFVKEAIAANQIWTGGQSKKDLKAIVKEIRANYEITVRELVPGLPDIKGRKEDHYNKGEVFEQALPLKAMNVMSEPEIDKLRPKNGWLAILLKRGNIVKLDMNAKEPTQNLFKGLTVMESSYHPGVKAGETIADLHCELFRPIRKKNLIKLYTLDLPIKKIPRPAFFGIMPPRLTDHAIDMELVGMSRIEVTGNGFNPVSGSVFVNGRVHPSIPLLNDMPIDISFDGDEASLSATFTARDLDGKLPGFIKLKDGSITISVNDKIELSVDGDLNFEIPKLGNGSISAGYSVKEGFHLDGHFEFDKGLFDHSEVNLSYKKAPDRDEHEFSIEGDASLDTKKSKIFKKLGVHVGYEKGVLSIGGDAETKLPGVSKGHIDVVTGGKETVVKAGFTIDDSIPGIQSGELNFNFVKDDTGEFNIQADATVLTKFPGISQVQVKGEYNSNGTFLFQGQALLKKGKFNGSINFGITNREIDENGQLTDKPGKELIAFGSGDANFQVTDWLAGKVGVEIKPDARVILAGTLKPEPVLPIIGKKKLLDEKIPGFSLPEFILFGIPLANIFVTASGGLYAEAEIGPVALKDAEISVKNLDIDKPEDALVEGSGAIDIPGHAEAGINVTITVGARVLVVKARVNINGSIGFGITGNAGLKAAFTWSVKEGFNLKESTAYLKARTELIGRLGGDINVDLDLWLGSINLYEHEFEEVEKRWPLGLDMDLSFPLKFGGEGGGLQLPQPSEIKKNVPSVDKDKIKQSALEEPPEAAAPAPSKEEALNWLRGLPANATLGSNWITNKFERYNYVKNIWRKYPDMDWKFLDEEIKRLDQRDFNGMRQRVLTLGDDGSDFVGNLKLLVIDEFVEEHVYINYEEVEQLKGTVRNKRNDS
jgi:hypothetical protein